MTDIQTAYRRSAFPGFGISLDRVMAEPALRTTLELFDRVHAQAERKARRTGAGTYITRSAN
jgi:hypothetical protein